MYGGVTFCHSVFWDENICPLFGGVRCIEVSVSGGSTVYRFEMALGHVHANRFSFRSVFTTKNGAIFPPRSHCSFFR